MSSHILTLAEMERDAIEEVMDMTDSLDDAAAILGIGRATVARRLKDYKLQPIGDRPRAPSIDDDEQVAARCRNRVAALRQQLVIKNAEVRELQADVVAWQLRYEALSRLGAAAADYFDKANPTTLATARGEQLRSRR